LTGLCARRKRREMKYLLNLAIFAFVAWGIWKTANRWFNLLGGNRPPTQPPVQPQTPRDTPAARARVVEETRQCPVCGTFVALGGAKCERPDCPQP
jgi:hypothetical protein